MHVEPEPPDLNRDTVTGRVCQSSQREVTDALNREAGENAENGEEDKRAQVGEDNDAEEEGGI